MADPSRVNSGIFPGDASGAPPGLSCALAWTPTVGNYLCVSVTSGSATNPASALVADNQTGTTHTYTKEVTNSDATNGTVQKWWVKVLNIATLPFTLRVSQMGSANDTVVVEEIANVHDTNPIIASGFLAVTGFTETFDLSKLLASAQINAWISHAVLNSGSGHTYTYRGDLTKVQDQNTVVTGNVIAVGSGKLSAHGDKIVATIQIEAADSYSSATIIFRGTDPVVTGPGGAPYDDRYRFRGSQLWSGTSTLGTKRSAWPEDARDGGERDLYGDFRSRMN